MRRSRGSGSLFQRGDGRWCARVTEEDGSRRYIYGRSEAEVRDRLDTALRNQSQGLTALGSRMRLGKYLWWWLENVQARNLSYNSEKSLQTRIGHIDRLLGHIQLRNVKAAHAYTYLATRDRKEGVSASTLRCEMQLFKQAMSQAVKLGMLPNDPLAVVDLPKGKRTQARSMTADQAAQLLTLAQGTRDYPLWHTLLATGMRVGEALSLYWEDVDLAAGLIYVRTKLEYRSGDGMYRTPPKSESGVRTIDVDEDLIATLRTHRKAMMQEQPAGRAQFWVFPSPAGMPQYAQGVYRRLHTQLRRANLPEFTVHELRHTMATLLLAEREYARVVQERLGHKNVSTTLQLYGHTTPTMQREAAARIGKILRRPKPTETQAEGVI